MANSDIIRQLLRDDDTDFTGTDIDADDNSEWIKPKDFEEFGLILDIGTESGTSPTLDIKVQMSLDGGTTALDTYPATANSETQATLTQITAAIETSKFWENRLALSGEGTIDPRIRFVFDTGGTSPVFPCTGAWIVLRKRGR